MQVFHFIKGGGYFCGLVLHICFFKNNLKEPRHLEILDCIEVRKFRFFLGHFSSFFLSFLHSLFVIRNCLQLRI